MPLIFSRAALARNDERVSPASLAAQSIASSNPASREMFALTGRPLSMTSGTAMKAPPSASVSITSGSVAAQFVDRARLWRVALHPRVANPFGQGVEGVSVSLVFVLPHGDASREDRETRRRTRQAFRR